MNDQPSQHEFDVETADILGVIPTISPIVKEGIVAKLTLIGEMLHPVHSRPPSPAPATHLDCSYAWCKEINDLRREVLELP